MTKQEALKRLGLLGHDGKVIRGGLVKLCSWLEISSQTWHNQPEELSTSYKRQIRDIANERGLTIDERFLK